MLAKSIQFLVCSGYQPLDLAGPMAVFSTANDIAANSYELHTVGLSTKPVRPNSGPRILPDSSIYETNRPHTLVIVGGPGMRTLEPSQPDRIQICALADASERVVTICTGTFLAAELALLNGKIATTHWRHQNDLQKQYPLIKVQDDKLYTVDGKIWSSAGVTAGIDLALAIVRQDLGDTVAATVARQLVVYLHRDGGQNQYADGLRLQFGSSGKFAELLNWIRQNLSEDLSIPKMAERVGMSERHFQRRFKDELGQTAAAIIEKLRIEHAMELLTTSKASVSAVSQATGFNNPDSFRRSFERIIGISPNSYKKRFQENA